MKYLATKPYLVIFIFTFLFLFILDKVVGMESSFLRAGIGAGLAVILSPRKKKITTQTGEKTQITWFLLKEPIFLD